MPEQTPAGRHHEDLERRARAVAEIAHHGQVYGLDRPYIEHPALVRLLTPHVRGYDDLPFESRQAALQAAWLHDTVEDCEAVTAQRLLDLGFPYLVVRTVALLTHDDRTEREEYVRLLSRDPVARVVKLADNAANTSQLDRLASHDPQRAARLEMKYLADRRWLGAEDHWLDNLTDDAWQTLADGGHLEPADT